MTAQVSERRTKTGRELAEKFGVSRSTIVRTIAEPRAAYEGRARARRTVVIKLRRRGLTYREISERTGNSVAIVGRLLADARRNGEWDVAAERHHTGHVE